MKKWNGYQRGINLGGWLSQNVLTAEHCNTFITESDIKIIASWGFDHIRLPIDYNLILNDDGSFIESGFKYIDSFVEWCGKYSLNMILDLHKTAGFSFDEGEDEKGFFYDENMISLFISIWTELAERYGKYNKNIAFELLNEIVEECDNEPWQKIAERTVKEIRRYAPETKILIGSYMNNSVLTVKDIALPFDENIVYNFHCYEPLLFTHQGAYWVKDMPADFTIEYPVSKEKFLAKSEKVPNILTFEWAVPDSGFNTEYFKNLFHEAIETAEKRDVTLYCGEYGVIELSDPESVLNWYRDIHAVFEKYGIGRAIWCYKGKDFGISDGRLNIIQDEIIKNS
ncbi:MAG: glycoside hydrolase family 5 protein [Ruminococcus sp.]|nr:glycoside hydrolase family 5 protein [Ruminococcus sp.]